MHRQHALMFTNPFLQQLLYVTLARCCSVDGCHGICRIHGQHILMYPDPFLQQLLNYTACLASWLAESNHVVMLCSPAYLVVTTAIPTGPQDVSYQNDYFAAMSLMTEPTLRSLPVASCPCHRVTADCTTCLELAYLTTSRSDSLSFRPPSHG
jgi:hypothetical protein